MLQRSTARYVVALYIIDMVLTVVALFAARWLRIVVPLGRPLDAAGAAIHLPMVLLALLVWSITLVAFRVYDPARFAHATDEIQVTVVAIGVATLALAGALYMTYRGLSRLLYVYFFALDVLMAVGVRLLFRRLMTQRREAHRRGVLIVGAGDTGQRVAHSLEPMRWMGIEVVGYLDDESEATDLPILGRLDEAERVIEAHGIEEIIIALPMDAQHHLANLVSAWQSLPVNIKVVPDYSEIAFYRTTLEQFGGLFFIGIKEPVIGPIDRLLKRFFDLIFSVLLLIMLAPALLVIAAAIKLTSPGPVLYRSRRVGENGHLFEMLKFRTMYRDADKEEQALVRTTAEGELLFDKRRDDPRITPLGRWLRRYSLDELPQLLNVLVGDMSLVGPRPELPALVAHYEPWQRKRFSVPQGVTGWWQISGRSAKAKYLHVEDDLYYIRHYSLLLDLNILWRTLGAVVRGEGAF
jgi:exopolysaccharide biosynthesis polyprenyl glycosylphosphotransferase